MAYVDTYNIKSENDLKKYIDASLGGGIVRVDLTNDQYTNIIKDTIQRFYEEINDGVEEQVLVINIPKPNADNFGTTIQLTDDIMAITDVFYANGNASSDSSIDPFNANYIMADIWRHSINTQVSSGNMSLVYIAKSYFDELAKMFSKQVPYSYNTFTKILSISSTMTTNVMFAATVLKAIDDKKIYSHQFIKRYAVALAKKQWGINMSKYNGAVLLGGMELNGQMMIDMGERELEKIEEDIWEKWNDPMGIFVG